MTHPAPPTDQPDGPSARSIWQRIRWLAGPPVPDWLKNSARAVVVKLGEYWLVTSFVSLLVLIWFVGFAESKAGEAHWEYWWSVLTGNYQPAIPAVRNEFARWEYGISLVFALLINITPLVGVILFIPRYVKKLMQLQEQPVKLHQLLDMDDGLVKSELVNEFGQSDEVLNKIKSVLTKVKAKRPEYVYEVFGQQTADFFRLLNKDLTN